MFSKKLIILCLVLGFAAALSLVGSYSLSKSTADKYVRESGAPVVPDGGHLVLFFNDRLISPRWRFVYEYKDVITGSIYDVQVSLFGKLLEVPEDRKQPKEGGS